MNAENLLIVFAKNILLGKVKTRLAKTIGDTGAFQVYKYLVEVTEQETNQVENCDIHIYWTDTIIDTKWKNAKHFIQEGDGLGERMSNAFQHAFDMGYKRVIGIGSDLPDLSAKIMREAIELLQQTDTVFGPSEDGGYYLLGMKTVHSEVFEGKAWSTERVLPDTLTELEEAGISYKLLPTLNDIDNLEDLKSSSIKNQFKHLYDLSESDE